MKNTLRVSHSEQPGQDLNAGLSVSRAAVLTVAVFTAVHLQCWDPAQGLTHWSQLVSH